MYALRYILLAGFFSGFALLASPEEGDPLTYEKFGLGSTTAFIYHYGVGTDNSGTDTILYEVVAKGDDYIVFYNRANAEYADDPAEAYYVEFSGVLFETCDNEMPSVESRELAKSFWSLKPGEAGDLKTEPREVITAGETDQVYINGIGAIEVRNFKSEIYSAENPDEVEDETGVLISSTLKTSVRVAYNEEDYEVMAGAVLKQLDRPVSLRHKSDMGNCAQLLGE